MDEAIIDAATGDGEINRSKLLRLFPAHSHHATFVQESQFIVMETDTDDLQSLRAAQPHVMDICADDSDYLGSGITTMTRYDIIVHRGVFLDLACFPEKLYVREGYDELYEYVCEQWKSDDRYRVVLLGNEGTGKSWFSVYALKLLMSCVQHEREFDFVIRQVDTRVYLIDLDEAKVYRWEISPQNLMDLSEDMERTLYLFEPAYGATISPLGVYLPSLSTLSRCKEYERNHSSLVYLWPWSSGELRALIQDSNLAIGADAFSDRFHKFGGVVRHVLGEQCDIEWTLPPKGQFKGVWINILTSTHPNIDRYDSIDNLIGFLICYDNRSIKGRNRFAVGHLEYTSAHVVDEVQSRIRTLPVKTILQNVLARLSGTKVDISGKNLERAALVLLSHGSKLKWERKEIGANDAGWNSFLVSERNGTVPFWLTDRVLQPDLFMAPTNKTSLDIDSFRAKKSRTALPVMAFQCTWAKSHEIKVKALCRLRRQHMRISDEQMLEIYLICPNHEDAYVARNKEEFLAGALNGDLHLDNKTIVYSSELEAMSVNTKFYVLRPKSSWVEQIGTYLSNHP